MRHYLIKVLRRGDSVLNVLPGQIVIRRKNGEVDIVAFDMEGNVPRMVPDLKMTITYGNDTVELVSTPPETSAKSKGRGKGKKTKSGPASETDDEVVTGTF